MDPEPHEDSELHSDAAGKIQSWMLEQIRSKFTYQILDSTCCLSVWARKSNVAPQSIHRHHLVFRIVRRETERDQAWCHRPHAGKTPKTQTACGEKTRKTFNQRAEPSCLLFVRRSDACVWFCYLLHIKLHRWTHISPFISSMGANMSEQRTITFLVVFSIRQSSNEQQLFDCSSRAAQEPREWRSLCSCLQINNNQYSVTASPVSHKQSFVTRRPFCASPSSGTVDRPGPVRSGSSTGSVFVFFHHWPRGGASSRPSNRNQGSAVNHFSPSTYCTSVRWELQNLQNEVKYRVNFDPWNLHKISINHNSGCLCWN